MSPRSPIVARKLSPAQIKGLPVRAIVTEANLADKDLGMPSTQRERIADVIFHTFDMQSEYLSSKKRRVSSLERVFL